MTVLSVARTIPSVLEIGVVHIARCPEHGLHGQRTECFVCGGPVEQVPMVPAPMTPGVCARPGCGASLSGMRANAVWCSRACYIAAKRAARADTTPTRRVKRRPGGRQASLGPAIRMVAAGLVDEFGLSEAQAERLARKWLARALPARQRTPRPHRVEDIAA